MQSITVPRKIAWLRVLLLSVAAFIFNTTEFVPVGLLSAIAGDFNMSPAGVGIMLTIYAWIVALMSLPLMLVTRQMERRRLLIVIFTIFAVSHVLSLIAWNFWLLVLSRIGIALAHAIFWSITASLIIRVAPVGKKNQALSMLATGTGLAMVVGVPLGRIIGQYLGWRMTFGVIGFSALVLIVILAKNFPKLQSEHGGSFSSIPILFKRPALVGIYLLIALVVTSHYTAYSYIEPFMQTVDSMKKNFTTLLLLFFGGAGILGSIIFSLIGNKRPAGLAISAVSLLTLCMGMLSLTASHPLEISIVCIFWGIAMMIISLSMQARVLSLASDATDVAMSLFSGIYNLGIGAGALLGSQVSHYLKVDYIGDIGAILGFFSLIWCVYIFYRYPQLCSND